jgi:hypothetical protein
MIKDNRLKPYSKGSKPIRIIVFGSQKFLKICYNHALEYTGSKSN